MEFFDLKRQHQNLKVEIDAAVLNVLESGVFIGGPAVENFEKEAADFLGVKHAIGLNSGTDALVLALKALDIGAGDEVITSPFTFFATAEAIVAVGAKPVFVDIDPRTFNIDADKIESAITKNTKAIMPVHLFGQMADMPAILAIAQKHDLKIIEDCAQAIGAKISVKREAKSEKEKRENEIKFAGTMGDAGCFSFFPTKNLGACGDGGMVATDNDEVAAKIKMIKSHGSSPEDKYKNLAIGVNSRLDAIQAAILSVKIKYLDQWNSQRAANAAIYNKELAGAGDIQTPPVAPKNNHVYHQYTIRTSRRDDLAKYLKSQGIPTMVYYPIPLHLQPALAHLGHKPGDLPESERVSTQVLSLPIYPELLLSDIDAIINGIKKFYAF